MPSELAVGIDYCTELCEKLGLDPDLVQSITLTPGGGQAVLFKLNEDGKKYVGEDEEVAVETVEIAVVYG